MEEYKTVTRYGKDNKYAYLGIDETVEEENNEKEKVLESVRLDESEAAVKRRKKLLKILETTEDKIKDLAEQVSVDDLEMMHGETEQDLDQVKCCPKKYIDPDLLNDPRVQRSFLIKALLMVTISYVPATVYAMILALSDKIRDFYYKTAPIYFLISTGIWIGCNIFGRMMKNSLVVIPVYIIRVIVLSNFMGSIQLFAEYFIWEFLFYDPYDHDPVYYIKLEERLSTNHPFPESWLDLPNNTDANDFLNRKYFCRAYFGALYTFSCFSCCFSILIILVCCPGKNMKVENLTGNWMKRTGAITSISPSIIFFLLVNAFDLTGGPRSFDFFQIYLVGLMSLGYGVIISYVWDPLLSGNSWFKVEKHHYPYFAFMFSI